MTAHSSFAVQHSRRPIGIFDSGIGGLTVLKELMARLPSEQVIYFGDTARLPYGTKSKETITRFSTVSATFLQSFNIKMLVVACNTASSLSLEALRERFSMPIIGVIEPGARQALRTTKRKRIGVIGTKATISSGAYEACLKRFDPSDKVYSEACPLFVPFVEEGWLSGSVVSKVAKTYLEPLKSFNIDTLILGCTHYPVLKTVIQKTVGPKVRLIDSAEETAKVAQQLLKNLKLIARRRKEAFDPRFFVSDEPEQFRSLGGRFLKQSIHSVTKVTDYV